MNTSSGDDGMEIEYNGAYPNLCSGLLVVIMDGVRWEFPPHCMQSGGTAYFTDDYCNNHVEHGPWMISKWPEGFPEQMQDAVEAKVNSEVELGCCGGCL